jgi:hypothetical protein
VISGVVVEDVVTVGGDGCVGSDGTGTLAPTEVPLPVSTVTPTEPLSASTEAEGVVDVEPPVDPEPPLGTDPPPPVGGVAGGAPGTGDTGGAEGALGDVGAVGLVCPVGVVWPPAPSERTPGALLPRVAVCDPLLAPSIGSLGDACDIVSPAARVPASPARGGADGGVRWCDAPGITECQPWPMREGSDVRPIASASTTATPATHPATANCRVESA